MNSIKKSTQSSLAETRLRDLLIGALCELKESVPDFSIPCENIGITAEELSSLGF